MKHYFLRHFQTKINPEKPVSKWELSEEGKNSLESFVSNIDENLFVKIFSSSEHKATIIAKVINRRYGIPYQEFDILRELNRDDAGYLDNEYTNVVRDFFNEEINENIKWESRVSLERRIKQFLVRLKEENESILVIGHGLHFTLMLAPILNQTYFEFWSSLKFGELINISKKDLFN
jgi:broad specificity phosphatase PhoE